MFNFTLKRTALSILLTAAVAVGASAQTFLYEGICYKASGNKLTILDLHPAKAKDTPKPENGTLPEKYTGDVVIPESITYNGKTYKVTEVGTTAFKNSDITSFTFASTITKVGKGIFQDCASLTNVTFSTGLTKLGQNMFNGCTALTELTIPGVFSDLPSGLLTGCTALTKLTLEEGETPLSFGVNAFGLTSAAEVPVKELYLYHQVDLEKYTEMANKPFRGCTALETVVIGGNVSDVPASYFENCANLKNVTFQGEALTTIGTSVFAATAIENIAFPEGVKTISSGILANASHLNTVTLGSAVETIEALAFKGSTLAAINFPATLTSIGDMAFSGTQLSGAINLPAEVKTIGAQAFATCPGITSMAIPAATKRIGDGFVMGCSALASFSVDAASENYSTVNDNMLQSKDGATLVAVAPAAGLEAVAGNYTELAPYAAYGCTTVKSANLPNCTTYGDYSLYGAGLTSLRLAGTVGRYVAANNTAMTALTLATPEIPVGVAQGNTALTDVTLPEVITVVKQDAFKGCTSLKALRLGGYLAILEADCFAGAGITSLEVASTFPPAMAEGVFTAESNITATVPADLVDTYKAADGWSYLTIVGDANLAAQGADMGMPAGLYYAGDDGVLHCTYADGQSDTYEVGDIAHTFQLLEYSNRIYGASAGKKFVYSATGSTDGDGKLFYISKVGGQIFQAVVLDNAGNNAYKDPFGLYLYGEDLYVNDRNVCIRKIPASAIALPQSYNSWMENNWLGYYGQPWTYGCIKSGFAITQTTDAAGNPEPLYWVGMKYNGNGIFRFREKDIIETLPEGQQGRPLPAEAPYLVTLAPIFTTFNLDVANGHMYIYVEKMSDNTLAGLYRVNMADIEANPNPSSFAALNPVLIDGSPVKYEGAGANEHVGISQLAFDAKGEYMYWCYRAPDNAEEAALTPDIEKGRYSWAEEYDANNPMHHSGIKRIKLGEANPTVEMVVPGASGYGIAVVNYEGSTKPESGIQNIVAAQANLVSYAAGVITANEDVELTVYATTGLMVARVNLAAGETFATADLAAGVYVVAANSASAAQTLKIAL